MTTTLELPDDLAEEILRRASRQGLAVNDFVVELLSTGPATPDQPVAKTLPVLNVRSVSPERVFAPQEMSDLVKGQELQFDMESHAKAFGR